MHYYKRNIGDYAKKAGRLSMLQHGAYTLLIDSCYDRERFPTLDEAIEWTWASTTEEVEAVKFVLSRFFILGSDGEYTQDRILSELLEYHAKADTNKRIAIERETKRKESNTNRVHDVNEPPPNHKPITNNQEPIKEKAIVQRHVKELKAERFDEFWSVYPKKADRLNSQKAWSKNKCDAIADEVISGAKKYAEAVKGKDSVYTKLASSWLNGNRWNDGGDNSPDDGIGVFV